MHQTAGPAFRLSNLPPVAQDAIFRSDADLDKINAHFLVLYDGTLVYLRDVQYVLSNAVAAQGIEIEFTGRYGLKSRTRMVRGQRHMDYLVADDPAESIDRLQPSAIKGGKLLIQQLCAQIPTIRQIHPHGQVQKPKAAGRVPKLHSCCGPDVWMNVGYWASDHLGLSTTPTGPHDHGISAEQNNFAYLP